ncbi:TetR/AcrR family transcriptional regulator [Streptosporangium sp. 'caverna']|uniref:TetR/AcrR family transcriptional regulator n=1 Tax=Streptosporangium sp. 'caverna' TaxID=2202249 RepID=UPI000D7E21E2|nr:TetR family transcriptional regulator [Streptosporangium sp. 'caverna']AWS43167.1 TetR/AcrR family transcriptional regulator [Streptosporangium sp. 'caverna']
MSYDSSATRARLLAAAYDEFVRVGFAGARVDRIAVAASANKQAIYAYFGSKEALFDAVLADRLRVLADVVPFTPDDLAGYTGALFDELTADPGLQRLTQWKMLERPDASDQEREAHLSKAGAIAERYGVEVTTAMDAMMIALAAAQSWNMTAAVIRNPLDEDPGKRLAGHRAAIVTAVAAVTTALLDGPGERK